MSSADEKIVVLAIADRALRSMWSARLGLAGEIMVIADDFDDPALDTELRERAVLVTDAASLDVALSDHVAAIRERGWRNGIVLLGAAPKADIADPDAALMLPGCETRQLIGWLRTSREKQLVEDSAPAV